jgi:hypothetical protein
MNETIDEVLVLFDLQLQTAKSIQGISSQRTKVIPLSKIRVAFKVSQLEVNIRLYESYGALIPNAQKEVEVLRQNLLESQELLENKEGYRIGVKDFDPIHYLKSNRIRVHNYIEYVGLNAKCYRSGDVEILKPFFHEYHNLKFLEKHRFDLGEALYKRGVESLRGSIVPGFANNLFPWEPMEYEPEERSIPNN